MGLGVLAAGALPHVATAPISDLYHAPGATAGDQAALVLMWQATQGIFDALGLGVIGVLAATVVLIDPVSPIAAVGIFALIILNFVLDLKSYALSRAA